MTRKENKRRPKWAVPLDKCAPAFNKQRLKNRKRDKIAKASRRANRKK